MARIGLAVLALLAWAQTDRGAVAADRPDAAALAEHGIRRLSGQHLTLYTDLPAAPAVDELPRRFDQAVPEWCRYFDIDVARTESWQVTGYLMSDRLRFRGQGLLPPELPEFLHGFTRDNEIWVDDQESDYYRTHLVLHEGTHSFMFAALGSIGPNWYAEGMAERLATHSLSPDSLQLAVYPQRRDDFPLWGRIRLVQVERDSGRALGLDDLLRLPAENFLKPAAYAWSWAAMAFLDLHPRYHQPLRQLQTEIRGPALIRSPPEVFGQRWQEAATEWPVFVSEIDFGYDPVAAAIDDLTPGQPPSHGATTTIRSERGWQNTGWLLEPGNAVRLRASGRFQVRGDPRPWWSEADGVTIRYWRGRPLGQLLARVLEPGTETEPGRWSAVEGVGREGTYSAPVRGTLFLKVNDSPAELADNQGSLEVSLDSAGQ